MKISKTQVNPKSDTTAFFAGQIEDFPKQVSGIESEVEGPTLYMKTLAHI